MLLLTSPWLIGLLVIVFSIGVALCFVGLMVSLMTALGNKNWFWAAGMLLAFPLAAVFCLRRWQMAAWPGKMLLSGMGLLVFPIGYYLSMIQ
ncbi:hypothetical protein [Iodobacter ciconiae]|uniref:Transmembrane protein n=1 Tax=Iodobacter ciconiae TaxID=2496266 RepID=A0A3S8ZSK1_9NEIS|nr:hypothetical protein [Iodobacter ciconiae]AZN36467.1 hypothetical protein EJO50_08155 [Iodobacter ciconiae]